MAANDPTTDPTTDPIVRSARAVAAAAKDALYVSVGFGVLAFQKAQVRRQELTKRLGALPEIPGSSAVRAQVCASLAQIDGRLRGVEQRVDAALDEVQGRLPAQAADLMGQARHVGKAYQERVRKLAESAAA
ncbi:MAG: hypothetical protein ACKO91_00870 [Acidimicrobiales bacterium]